MTAGPGVRAALVEWFGNAGIIEGPASMRSHVAADMADALLADVLAPLLEEAVADGWDEGYWRGKQHSHSFDNPHRARREDAPDEGYVCEDCGCWNLTGRPCKYAAEHVEETP